MATDIQILRDLLEDPLQATFADSELTTLLLQANGLDPLPSGGVSLSLMYWAAYLGWVRKAGQIRVKVQKIAIFSKNTKVTYDAAIAQANEYKMLSLTAPSAIGSASIIGIQIPTLDLVTPFLESSVDGTDAVPLNGLAEIW